MEWHVEARGRILNSRPPLLSTDDGRKTSNSKTTNREERRIFSIKINRNLLINLDDKMNNKADQWMRNDGNGRNFTVGTRFTMEFRIIRYNFSFRWILVVRHPMTRTVRLPHSLLQPFTKRKMSKKILFHSPSPPSSLCLQSDTNKCHRQATEATTKIQIVSIFDASRWFRSFSLIARTWDGFRIHFEQRPSSIFISIAHGRLI